MIYCAQFFFRDRGPGVLHMGSSGQPDAELSGLVSKVLLVLILSTQKGVKAKLVLPKSRGET